MIIHVMCSGCEFRKHQLGSCHSDPDSNLAKCLLQVLGFQQSWTKKKFLGIYNLWTVPKWKINQCWAFINSTETERPAVIRVILPVHNSAVFCFGSEYSPFCKKNKNKIKQIQKWIFCLHSLFLKKICQKLRTKFFWNPKKSPQLPTIWNGA
jgi:hypothetical protein